MPNLWQDKYMPATRTIIFHLADRSGRPAMRTTIRATADRLVANGWTVTDVEVVVR